MFFVTFALESNVALVCVVGVLLRDAVAARQVNYSGFYDDDDDRDPYGRNRGGGDAGRKC